MKDYVVFSDFPLPVNLDGRSGVFGVVNGYKLKSILHGGRRISLTRNAYFYIPRINKIVSYKAGKARELVVADNKYNFQELFDDRKGHWSFKAEAGTILVIANQIFGA